MSQATRRGIYGKLAGDNTLTGLLGSPPSGYSQSIFYEQAPPKAKYPYLILQKQSGTPSYGMSSASVMDDEMWLIKAVDRMDDTYDSADNVDTIQSRLNALLTDGTLSISGKTQLYLRRESDVDYSENQDGVQYRHAGSLFRLTVT